MVRLLAVSASIILLSAPAVAADFGIAPPSLISPSSVYDWSGFYLGVQAGWGWADQQIEDDVALNGEVGLDGGFFGPVVGYQRQWDRFVLGVEVEASWSDIDGKEAILPAPGLQYGNIEIFGSAGVKLGYAWDRALIYATGGVSGAESGTLLRAGPFSTEDHAASFGWMAGAGFDYALTQQIILGLQYRHYDLGEADFDELGFVPARTGDIDLDTVSGHLTLKLGGW